MSSSSPASEERAAAFRQPWLIGQATAERLLARSFQRDRVAGAYLFLGPRSSGKATAAVLFAQVLNCEKPGSDPDRLRPCLECLNCRRIAAEKHPEVLIIHPGSKTGQNISVEQAREIRKNAALRPKLGSRRIYVIPQAEAFNEESANALLKTLEEPPETVTLILCAPNPSQVLPTIRSRCSIVRFALSRADEVRSALEDAGIEPGRADLYARSCGGRPGLGLAWAHSPAEWERRAECRDLFSRALALRRGHAANPSVVVAALSFAERLKAQAVSAGKERPARLQIAEMLETGLSFLRDALLISHDTGEEAVVNQDCLPALRELASPRARGELLDALRSVREAELLLQRNVTESRVLEQMFWRLIAGPGEQARPGIETA